jgi:hypothetical protein
VSRLIPFALRMRKPYSTTTIQTPLREFCRVRGANTGYSKRTCPAPVTTLSRKTFFSGREHTLSSTLDARCEQS